MADVAFQQSRVARATGARKRTSLRNALRRKSTVAFLMTLPLILLIALLVLYPAFYSAASGDAEQGDDEVRRARQFRVPVQARNVLDGGEAILHLRDHRRDLQGADRLHRRAFRPQHSGQEQRKWRGMLLVPWVIPPAMSTLAWLWLFDPSYSAFNYTLSFFGIGPIPWTGDAVWARFSVILVNVWYGAPFFMIMYLAALKSVPEQLYEAAAIDGANWWQRIWYVTLPMMRNIIAITTLFSLIVTFANFDIVRILTSGGPLDQTHIFATWAFRVGIEGSDIPLGASVSLFMVPILAIAAIFILRDINKRGNEA